MKSPFLLFVLIIPLLSFGQDNSWWQVDGSIKINSGEHTFRSPIVSAQNNIKEDEMFLVDLNVYRGQEQSNLDYGIYSKGLGDNAYADLKVYHRKAIDSPGNPNESPNYGFDFTENNYLVYGCKTAENPSPNFTNHEESWNAYGYYTHGWNFMQTQIKSTDYTHLWNRPKSATWWDTFIDVTIGVFAIAVIVGATIVTAGAAPALLGGITVAGTATISVSSGTIAGALFVTAASLYITYSIYKNQGYLLDNVDNRGYSQIIAQTEFVVNMELPMPDKIPNPSNEGEKKWNQSIDAIEKSAFDCSNIQGQKCYKAPIKEMVAEMKIKNSHVKYVNIPGELNKNITPYQLFENYQYIVDESGVISASLFSENQLMDAADYFDLKRQVLPRKMIVPNENFTFDILLEDFRGTSTFYIASSTPPEMDELFYMDLGLYGTKNDVDYRLYRIQAQTDAGEIPIVTGPNGPFLVGDNIELNMDSDLTVKVYREDETPVIEKSYYISIPNPIDGINLQPGDSVVFTSKHNDFFLEGVPEIWLARSAGDSRYYCSPNTKPNEYRPFLGYDSQVHGVALRKYTNPENIKTPSIRHNESENTYSWYWIAQRRMDANVSSESYSPTGNNVIFSKYKNASDLGKSNFPIGGGEHVTKQRNNQREGYNMQLLWAWEDKENYDEYSGPEYILGLDPDEIIYLNCNGAKIPSPHTKIPDALLSVNVEEWKRIPEGENANPIAKMVEAYVKNRNFLENNEASSDNYEYHGYEIMDSGIFRTTNIPGVSTENAPCNGKSCVEYFSEGNGEEDNNIKAPGKFNFKKVYPDGVHTSSSINIPIDLESIQNTDYGFYGSIEGDQWPSEWQKQVPYSFKGLDGLPESTLNKLVMEYSHENELGILTTDTRYFRDSERSVVDGKWTEYFDLKGWGYNEITVYVQRKPGATKVPIAGMELLEIMLRFVSAPGSKWQDFSPTAFDGIDLKEGRGEGNYWYLRDSNEDESNHFLYGNPSDAINKSYTISKDDRIVFNAMDSDPHTFFHYDIEWYVSERFMSKRLSSDELDSRIQWFLAPIDYDGLGEWIGNGRWLDKTFDSPGKYRLTAVYGLGFNKNNDLYSNTRMSHIINVLSAPYDSSHDVKKGTIDIYEMSSDQINWIQEEFQEVDSSWRVASINNIFSRWTHIDGPRAEPPNDKPNRYGNENDYNAHFEWYENRTGREGSVEKFSLTKYVTPDTNLEWFPFNWIRHYSGSTLPSDMDISQVEGGVTTSSEGIDNALRNAFPNDTPEHWQWRLPWVSITNWQGYKIRNNIKAVFNMNELFDNQKGAFSGVGMESMTDEEYANSIKSPIPAYTDNYKSKYDFYLDLLSGRKQIFNPNYESFLGSLSVNQVNDLAEDQYDVNNVVITKPNLNYKEGGSFLMGADMSIVKNLEDGGVTWKRSILDKSNEDPYYILTSSGANTVRFRLWLNPKSPDGTDYLYSTISSVKEEILRAKLEGLKVVLDIHYSDTWADPNQNIIPSGWLHGISDTSADGNVDFLATQIATYTKSVLDDLYSNNALPDIVQVGNEINGNILLTDSYQSLTLNEIASQIGVSQSDLNDDKYRINWDRNARLINAGLVTIKNNYPEVQTMLHLASPFFTQWWLNEAFNQNTPNRLGTEIVNQDLVDIVGMSYYLGELDQQQSLPVIKQIIDNIGDLYDKKVLIVETAFPKTYDWSDNTTNLYSEINNGAWPAETDFNKQYNWLLTLRETLKTSPYSIGFLYWEPFWVGSNSVETKDFIGSNWENMSFCDFVSGLPTSENIVNVDGGLKVFTDPYVSQITSGDDQGGIYHGSRSSKLQIESESNFEVYATPKDKNVIISFFPAAKYNIEVYNLQGKLIYSNVANNVNTYLVSLNKLGVNNKILLLRITNDDGIQHTKKIIIN